MYLERRSNLKLLILLTDARREPLSSDAGILEYAQDNDNQQYKVLVVATKVRAAGSVAAGVAWTIPTPYGLSNACITNDP